MKTRKVVIPVILFVSVLLLANGVTSVGKADSSTWSVRTGQSAQWLVMASSNVTTMWYSETFTPVGNFSAPVGSLVNLTVTSTVGGRCCGNVTVGNLALSNVSMSEISFNLLLGWYPFQPGFISPVNWDVQRQNATGNGFAVRESRIGDIETVTFQYLADESTGTILTYDKDTGLLINGYGSFGNFMIEVTLISTNIDIGSVQSVYQALGTTNIMIEGATMMGAAALIIIFVLASRRSKGGK